MKSYSIPRTIWRVLYPVLIFLVISAAVGIISGGVIGAIIAIQDPTGGAILQDTDAFAAEIERVILEKAMVLQLASSIAGLAVFLPMWLKSRKWSPVFKNTRPAFVTLLAAGLFLGVNLILMILFTLVDIMKYFPSYDTVSQILTGGSPIMQILAIGIGAPIVEELCFRGILINRMRRFPVWAAVLIQAALFGAVHLNPLQMLYAFALGLLLGFLYARFRSIILVIAAHMVFNMTSVLLGVAGEDFNALFILIPAILLTPICAYLLLKHAKPTVVFDPAAVPDVFEHVALEPDSADGNAVIEPPDTQTGFDDLSDGQSETAETDGDDLI